MPTNERIGNLDGPPSETRKKASFFGRMSGLGSIPNRILPSELKDLRDAYDAKLRALGDHERRLKAYGDRPVDSRSEEQVEQVRAACRGPNGGNCWGLFGPGCCSALAKIPVATASWSLCSVSGCYRGPV